MNTSTLNGFLSKYVEIYVLDRRFTGIVESLNKDEITLLPIGRYDRIHYGSQIIMTRNIIAIREIIPESRLTKEDLDYSSKKTDDDEEDSVA